MLPNKRINRPIYLFLILSAAAVSAPAQEAADFFRQNCISCHTVGGGKDCDCENPCTAHEAWRGVRTAYLDFLHTKTVADISKPEGQNVAH